MRRILLGTVVVLPFLGMPALGQSTDEGLFTPVEPGDPSSAARALGINIPVRNTPVPDEDPARAVRDGQARARLRDQAAATAQAETPAPSVSAPVGAAPITPPAALVTPPVFESSQPRQVVNVAPSRTELIPVAAQHLNRIVTPFVRPVIQTVATEDEMQTRIEGSIIYIALNETQTIFVHEEGVPEAAVGLALVPRMMPPREIVLNASGTALASQRGSFDRALRAPSRPPVASGRAPEHVQMLHDVMVALAKAEVPEGFRLFDRVTDLRASDVCRADLPVQYDFSNAQMMVSDRHVILIARAVLRGSRAIDLQEVWCNAQPATIGVAYYPYTELVRQGQDTEVYIVLSRDEYEEARPMRRRLVSSGD